MKAERQQKDATSRVIQPSKGGGGHIVDNRIQSIKEILPFTNRGFVLQAARHIVDVNTMGDSFENSSETFTQKSNPIQLTGCTVYLNGRSKGEKDGVAKGGIGGVSHAEQLAWIDSGLSDKIKSGDEIEFEVDRPICGDCAIWFEKTLYPIINAKGGTLKVSVTYQKETYDVTVTGVGTDWGKASEEGFYA